MGDIKEVKFGKQPPQGLAEGLRELADKVDRGEVVSVIAAYIDKVDDEYCFLFGASLSEELVMCSLMHAKLIDKFRR